MKIYILRHEKRFGKPSFETSLTEKGLNGAEKLTKYLENLDIDVIYCSPFKRIIQTIEPYLISSNKKVNIDYSLYEFVSSKDFSQNDVRQIDSSIYGYDYVNLEYNTVTPVDKIVYPESKEGLNERLSNFIENIDKESKKNILLVTHMSPIHNILNNQNVILENLYPQGGLSLIYNDKYVFEPINFNI